MIIQPIKTDKTPIVSQNLFCLLDRYVAALRIKPEHIVLRVRPDGALLRQHDGQRAYALRDYELLERFREAE